MPDNIAQSKLVVLYALDRVGPMSGAQVLRFLVENQLAEYIDTQLTLTELLDGGMLVFVHQDGTRVYHFTQKGRQTLEMLEEKLKHSTRQTIDELALTWAERVRTERQISAEYERDPDGDYTVRLRAHEKNGTLLAVDVRVPDREQAELACGRFRESPGDILGALLNALLDDTHA